MLHLHGSLKRCEISERNIKSWCCPHGFTSPAIPLGLTVLALLCTCYGSWSCTYFEGANIDFTNHKNYGLWTIEDAYGKCQLWDVLFFSYNLDFSLKVARAMSMSSMVLGLAMVTTTSQALQCHIVSWGVGLILTIMFIISAATTSIFNLWAVFWLFTYIIYVLIVRYLFFHPVPRRISPRGSKMIAVCFLLCMLFTALAMVVLTSNYCTCDSLTVADLEDIENNTCDGTCRLTEAGYVMILASILWLGAAIATQMIGVQPAVLDQNPNRPTSTFTYLSQRSIRTQVYDFATRHAQVFKPTFAADDHDENETQQQRQSTVHPRQTRMQQACCDYVHKPRSCNEQSGFCMFRCGLFFLVVIYIFIVVILIRALLENNHAEKAPDTTPNFILDPVCAFNPSDNSQAMETFDNAGQAHEAGFTIAHCGPCANCSNLPDIQTYVETRETIADSAKECSLVVIFGTYSDLVQCLEDRINFSSECTTCWADNMINTGKECKFSCLSTLLTGFLASNNVAGSGEQVRLNHCFECDEKMSGTAFVTCSGVARRRLGIESAIERNPDQLCKTVGSETVKLDWLMYFDDKQGPAGLDWSE
jgi:hypothetical protein